jgi:hypothetical protein
MLPNQFCKGPKAHFSGLCLLKNGRVKEMSGFTLSVFPDRAVAGMIPVKSSANQDRPIA